MATSQYMGMGFPFRATGTEFPASATDNELVQASIAQLLMTQRGERVMRPDTGSAIYSLLFENDSELLDELIRTEVLNTIGRYEPRVIITSVDIKRNGEEIQVDIQYALRSTGEPGRVETTFPLGTP